MKLHSKFFRPLLTALPFLMLSPDFLPHGRVIYVLKGQKSANQESTENPFSEVIFTNPTSFDWGKLTHHCRDARRWAEEADGKEPRRTRKHKLTQPHALAHLSCGLMAAQDGRCLYLSVSTPALTFPKSARSGRVAALRSDNPAVTQNAPFVSYLPGSYTPAIWLDTHTHSPHTSLARTHC